MLSNECLQDLRIRALVLTVVWAKYSATANCSEAFLDYFFFPCLTGAAMNLQVPDIYSNKKSFPGFKIFEPTFRIKVLIYFERCKGPVGINMIMI